MKSNKMIFFVPIIMCVSLALLSCSDDKRIEVEKKYLNFIRLTIIMIMIIFIKTLQKKIKIKTTKEQTLSLFEKEMTEAGQYKGSELVDYKETTYINKSEDTITLTYNSFFSKSYVEEIFYFICEEEQPKLSGYRYIIVKNNI